MSKQITYSCDECPTIKLQTNHWFSVTQVHTNGGKPLKDNGVNKAKQRLIIHLGIIDNCSHMCSEQCLLKRISKLICKS